MHAPTDAAPSRAWILFFAIALAGQAWLVLNPGYFSHDELQWAAFARTGEAGQGWGDWRAFQFRPLTFELWLVLARAWFGTPFAMHAVFVALGTAIGAGLLALLVRLGVAWRIAVVAALGFVLGPVAMYTHGWTATLADLLWVGCGMLGAHAVLRLSSTGAIAAVVAVVTVLALLAKEAAVVLPALAALAWWLSGKRREWAVAAIASAVPVVAYLALRADVILFASRPGGAYAWSLSGIPTQWLTYLLFPIEPHVLEPQVALRPAAWKLAVLVALLAALWASVARVHWRAATWGVVGGALALGPVLLLQMPSNQYAYAHAAVVAGALAVAWPRLGRGGKGLLAFLLLVSTLHGAAVGWQMHRVGALQARFSPLLAAAVAMSEAPVRVRLPERDYWVYQRLMHQIPAYSGVLMTDRVVVVANDDPAPVDYTIAADGSLVPAR
jgi:hypothetical protein